MTKQRQLSFMKIDKITDLPEPELTIVYQLSKLAYKGLCNSQLVFTYDEIKEVCPKVDETPGAINGFGLLQTVEYYHRKGAGKILSLNFLHFTMQEYLAALHVSTLPSEEKSSLIENIFQDGQFNFMWIMYVGIVGPHFISHMVSDSLYEGNHQYALQHGEYNMPARKSLFIFQCYLEGKKLKLIPEVVTGIFSNGNINLSKITLLPHHIMSLTVFMMRSTTQWKSLNLDSCSIGNNGMSILAKFFMNFKEMTTTMKYLNLRNNNLTSLWGTHTVTAQDNVDSCSELLQSVEDLDLSFNLICDTSISEYLKNNSSLCKLNLSKNNITDEGAKVLAETIQVNTILQELNICKNEITDEGAKIFAEAIQINTTLQNLNMSQNKITDEGAKRLAEAIVINKTLQELNISINWISKEGVMRIVEACTKNRTLHKLVCTHNNLSKPELAAINEYIRKEIAVQIFDASWNTIDAKGDELAIKTIFRLLDISKATFQLSGVQQKLQSDNDTQEELWFADEINELKYRREFLQCCIKESEHIDVKNANLSDMNQIGFISDCLKLNKIITEVNLCNCQVTNEGIKLFVQAVQVSTTLHSLEISNNVISDDGVLSISDFFKINNNVCKLNLSGNEIRDEGTKKLSEAIKVNTTLQDLNLSKNKITDKGANELSKAIEMNKTLQELNISKNWMSKEGVMRIVEACTINRTLHKLVYTHNNLSKSELAVINEYIRKENAVQIFDASWNAIGTKDGQLVIKTIFQLLVNYKTTFQSSGIQQKLQSIDDITDAKVELWFLDDITELQYRWEFLQCEHLNVVGANLSDMDQIIIISDYLKVNKKIIEVNLSTSQLSNEGIKVFVQAVEDSTTLHSLDVSNNEISDDGVLFISDFLKINTLCKINLCDYEIRDEGTKKFSEALQVNTTMQVLNMSRNKITDEGANELSKAIQLNKTLQELNISKNWISKEGVMRIVEACTKNRTLHKLVCTHNNLAKSELAAINEYIRKENAVQILDASWNTIGTKDGQLAIKTIFQVLENHKTTFQSSGMQQKLQSFDDITDAKVELWFLDEITEQQYRWEFLQCEHLNVVGANLSDNTQILIISDCLQVNKKIIEVNLCNCRVTNEGIEVLVQAVEDSATLHSLDISNNVISDDGLLFISNFLKINTLCKMNLSDNELRDEGTKKLSKAIKVNTTLQDLNISKNKIADDGAKGLTKAIQVNRTLQELNISKNLISNNGVMRIVEACTNNRTLHKLVCTHNNLSKSELAVINDYVKKENAVQVFDASWNSIVASGMCWSLIITTFQSLRWSLDGWEFTSFDYHKQVCIFIDGVWNDSSQCDFTSDSLKELNFPSHSIPFKLLVDIIQQVMEIDTLQKLIIPSNKISDDEAVVFSECLKTNTTLIELDLSRNYIRHEGASVIAEALMVNNTLKKLNISYNRLFDDVAIAFSECLKTNTSLIELDLSNSFIRDEGASVIAEGLMVNNTLQKLNISCNGYFSFNSLSDDGAIAFSEYLKTNASLIELNLSGNVITHKGASAIAETLMVNNTLQKLNISHNGLFDSGAISFSECLKTNTSLIELNLSGNVIECKGARANSETLMVNNTLQKLNISHNNLFNDGGIAFWECLNTNTTLIELDLSVSNINNKILQSIAQAIQANNKHKVQISSDHML